MTDCCQTVKLSRREGEKVQVEVVEMGEVVAVEWWSRRGNIETETERINRELLACDLR